MKQFPQVKTEQETINALLSGKSIARYGDGELKLCLMKNCVSQIASVKLATELKEILLNPDKVLVGLPDVYRSPKEHWKNYNRTAYNDLLSSKVTYYSSFITRPDNAPWIDTEEYWQQVVDLWRNKRVGLVVGSNRSLRIDMMPECQSILEYNCNIRRDAYEHIDAIEAEIDKSGMDLTILCLGAAATCLAYRLAKKGRQALDLGHIGMFMRHKGDYHGSTVHK